MFAFVFRFSGRVLCATALPLLVLAACTPAAEAPKPAAQLPSEPALTERRPDTCGLAAVAGLKGMPGGTLRTVRLKGPSRLIGPGEIVDQEDYVPQRINAYSDEEGIITRLECG